MKRILFYTAVVTTLFACNTVSDKGKFTVSGQIKNAADQKIYLEELYFTGQDPEILDTAEIKAGKFIVNGIAAEEGIYRIRLEKADRSFLFINDVAAINFNGDINDMSLDGPSFASPANASLKKFVVTNDGMMKKVKELYTSLVQMKQAGAQPGDSAFVATETIFNATKEAALKFNFQYADSVKSPGLALFTVAAPPAGLEQIQIPLQKLAQRFSTHSGIVSFTNFAKAELSNKQQLQQQAPGSKVGAMAPELTMNDVNDKLFSLSQLKGKYVLVDFWASWCGPCRAENPNVVAAYNKFKDKNFTVLGVSLDKDKAAWLKAIKDDGLNWQQISDLKYWKSAAVPLYGIDGIPYNVLVDPQGKIVASSLRGSALFSKLEEVLK